jgi:hypothetical protein
VVLAGAEIGLKVTPNLVRIVRYKMRHAGSPKPSAALKRPLHKARPPAPAPSEIQFRRLVFQIGTARAKALVAQVEQRLDALLSGR